MISIITCVRNQLAMNELFLNYLNKYTKGPFELIIIDNASTDGSREFYEKNGAIVISNEANYSYPHCQNQGIARAKYDILVFLNNDLIVSPLWDERLLRVMKEQQLDFVSFASNDRLENPSATLRTRRKWNYIKYPLQFFFGSSKNSLRAMHAFRYGRWEKWTQRRFSQFADQTMEGFSGSCIACSRKGLDKIGWWDERVQEADFDLYLRTKKRSMEEGDIRPIKLLLGVYFHHYSRLTLRSKDYVSFKDLDNIISCKEKWGAEMKYLLSGIES